MNIPIKSARLMVAITVDFRRLAERTAIKGPGQVHLAVNGEPICGMVDGAYLEKHWSGIIISTVEDFIAWPCISCHKAVNSRAA